MTVEEKAKAYDEVIKRVKKVLLDCTPEEQKVVEYITPELKDSEDSEDWKIRKDIVDFINGVYERGALIITDEERDNWIAWLEKQGEQKSAWSEGDGKMIDNIIDYMKPMPIFFESTKGKSGKEYTKEFIKNATKWLKFLKDRIQSQPKQEWKQENTGDLTDFENTMMHIGSSFFGQYAGLDPNDTNAIKEQANLLLKLVPSKEWSEEDEKQARQIERIVHNDGCTQKLQKQIADWLKSLKDRYTWRPSKEQMKALQESIGIVGELTSKGECLKELVEQLKAL